MDSDVRLYRRRFIPDEKKELKDDRILFFSDDLIATAWKTFKPRADFAAGISVYYRKEGWKVSKHYKLDGSFSRWYCDIINESHNGSDIIFEDLLIDVIIEADNSVHVVDLDEAADAVEQGLITNDMLIQALRSTDKLLRHIRHGQFEEIKQQVEAYEPQR